MSKATTQRMLQLAIMLISRQYRFECMFKKQHIKGKIFTDTMIGRYKSLEGNRYAQVSTKNSFCATAYPMEKNSIEGQ